MSRTTSRRHVLYSSAPAIFIFAFAACALLLPPRAQEQQGPTIRVGVNLVLVDATVKTKSGQIIGDLKKDDFLLREDGAQQKIDVFSRDTLPLEIALVLDTSDSIGPFFSALRDAAATTLTSLKPEDEVSLFTFSTEAQMRVPFTKDKAAIADQINTFKAGGATNINDGIFAAAEYLRTSPPNGRRVIVLISDDVGTDSGAHSTSDIITETLEADAPLYNLKIPGQNSFDTIWYASMVKGLVNIRKVMDQSGGEVFDVKNVKNLTATFGALIDRIKTRYTLGYYTSATGELAKPHKLDVSLQPSFGTKGRNYIVLSKNGFFVQ